MFMMWYVLCQVIGNNKMGGALSGYTDQAAPPQQKEVEKKELFQRVAHSPDE